MLPFGDAAAVVALPEFEIFGDALAGRIGRPGVALAGGRAHVEAGEERVAAAGQHDHLHGAVGIGRVKGAMQLRLEIGRDRIHAVRPVERDGRDAILECINPGRRGQIELLRDPAR
jgi:hypothetical protein